MYIQNTETHTDWHRGRRIVRRDEDDDNENDYEEIVRWAYQNLD